MLIEYQKSTLKPIIKHYITKTHSRSHQSSPKVSSTPSYRRQSALACRKLSQNNWSWLGQNTCNPSWSFICCREKCSCGRGARWFGAICGFNTKTCMLSVGGLGRLSRRNRSGESRFSTGSMPPSALTPFAPVRKRQNKSQSISTLTSRYLGSGTRRNPELGPRTSTRRWRLKVGSKYRQTYKPGKSSTFYLRNLVNSLRSRRTRSSFSTPVVFLP